MLDPRHPGFPVGLVETFHLPGAFREIAKLDPAGVIASLERRGVDVKNDILYSWATIVGKLLTLGDSAWKIGAMYIEFENVGAPEDPVSIPSITRDEGLEYFDNLGLTPDRDYLRIPILAGLLTSTDEELFPLGNKMQFLAITDGVVGVHGQPFSDSDNSKVCGGALAATPEFGDAAQDVLLNRFYYPEENQLLKLPTGDLLVRWNVTLG